jgi:hypothetical protein
MRERVRSLVAVSHTGCWEFTGRPSSNGYGQLSHNGKMRTLHRYAYEAFNEQRIPPGMLVRHTCDNRLCANPEHLILGTHRDNALDAVQRNPTRKGPGHPSSDKSIRRFVHNSGDVFVGTVVEFYSKLGLRNSSVWRMVKGKRPTAYGWRLAGGA